MDAENISNDGCSQRDSAEHKGYVRAHRSFNRIWKERDSAQPDLLEKILGEKQPDWHLGEDHPIQRYNPHNLLMVETPYWEAKEELSAEELEQVWSDAEEIYQEYSAYPIRKELRFIISVPHTSDTETVHLTSTWFFDFTEEGKRAFFERYAKKWDLMESGLPFVDE